MADERNLRINGLLYDIEVGLREFIIHILSIKYGSKWWKQRLPTDVLEKYNKGYQYEKNINWITLIPHHPIYYTDFTDIKKIIQRSDNWKDVFKEIFNNDVIIGTLTEIEPIRNKIAHNRRASQPDEEIVVAAFKKIVAFIGQKEFNEYIQNISIAEHIPIEFQKLMSLIINTHKLVRSYNQPNTKYCSDVINMWWFDEDYLHYPVNFIENYIILINEYNIIPRSRGSGHILETWIKDNNLDDIYERALSEITAIINESRIIS